MQLFQQPFDASTVKPNEAFEPIPDGWYILAIRNSEGKPTKDNESGYLQLEVEVIDGEHKGRKVFDILNLWNKSQQAAEIAQRQLSAYCHATGVMVLQDSQQLHGIPFKGKLSIRKDEGYDARNVVKAVKHIQDTTPTPGNPTLAHVPPAPSVPAMPFGQNPALPPQPAFMQGPPVAATPANIAPPWAQQQVPAQAPIAQPLPPAQPQQQQAPWAAPAQQPAAPTIPQQTWTPPAQPPMQQPTPATGPVPPWRR